MLRMLSLCSGIGGADLAAEWTGNIEIIGQVEIDPFCQAVLAKHWPSVKRMEDIKDVAGTEFGEINIVVGGIPCQPFSIAGKRGGTADDRYLWPEMLRIVRQCNPTWIIVENVAHFVSMALDEVLTDLESAGYQSRAFVIPACAIGAPHRRERVFIVSHADNDRQRIWPRQSKRFSEFKGTSDIGIDGEERALANACSSRWQERDVSTIAVQESHVAWSDVADSTGRREWQHQDTRSEERPQSLDIQSSARCLKSGVCRGSHGIPTGIHGHQWPAGPGEQQHRWEPPRIVTGKQPDRAKRLKALGNSIVPQQIYPIFKQIVELEVTHC